MPFGVFVFVGFFLDVSIDVLFVMAILATIGYSINDTIVIFDRIREKIKNNKEKNVKESFGDIVDYGVKKSFRRSMYTSLTTAIPLLLYSLLYVPTLEMVLIRLIYRSDCRHIFFTIFSTICTFIVEQIHIKDTKDKIEEEISELEKAEQRLKERLRE